MVTYKVKVYLRTGERLNFISKDLEVDDNPFPDLKKNEYLYLNYEDHKELFWILPNIFAWHCQALEDADSDNLIVNFTIHQRYKQDEAFVGLTREEAQELALGRNMSFRVVFNNGIADHWDGGYDETRVNVYLNQDLVYNAELY